MLQRKGNERRGEERRGAVFALYKILFIYINNYRLCGLVVRVSGYRYRGLGFDSRRYQIF